MNKIIDTQCECCNTDTILKIVAGNDFTLRLALTYHEDDVVKEYDLSDIQDLKVIAYSPEGVDREVDSMVDIATNRIIAVIDSYEYINYVPYGIDITWYDEPNHKRASAPNLFAFVNSSGEANDSQDVIVSGPYDYNLEIKSDIAYVSIGEIPDVDLTEYVTNSSLNTTLQNYESKKELETTLQYYATKKYVDDAMLDIDLSDYVTNTSLNTTLQNYESKKELETTLQYYATKKYVDDAMLDIDLSDYVTNTSLNTTLQDYVTNSALNTSLNPITSDITSLDNRVTTLENNPQVPSNVVTSDDGNEIVCLTQSEYDALEQAQTLEPDVFYYITDTTSNYVSQSDLTNYVTQTQLNTAISGVTIDETNLVHKTGSETITGSKTFQGTHYFNGECQFTDTQNNHTVPFADNLYEIAKSGIFGRGSFIQAAIGQIIAPTTAVSNSTAKYDNQVDTILFQKCDGTTGSPQYNPSGLTTLAKIDSNGIYEGNTLLSDKYALKSEIPTSSGVSEEDWDNSNEAIAKELLDNRLAHLSINDNFNNYYTKTESDNRYATTSWTNNKFVTKTDDVNRQEAIAAAFASSVQSTTIHNIVQISQSDYDALTTKDTNTLYIIL